MPQEPLRPSHDPLTEDRFAALVRLFMSPANPKWVRLSDSTKKSWSYGLNFAARPDCLGAVPINIIRPKLVQALFDGLALAGKHGKAHIVMTALRQLEKWAIVRDLLPREITTGIEVEVSDEHHTPWSVEQIELALKYIGYGLDRAILLGAYTGQRGSDTVRMSPNDLETVNGIEGINVVQRKTGKHVWIPIVSELAAAMATWERRPGPYLRNSRDKPWTRATLAGAFYREREENPELRPIRDAGLVLHGLRGHAAVQLRRAGANSMQIADMIGMSVQTVERYCKPSKQSENASAAVIHLERAIRERTAKTGGVK